MKVRLRSLLVPVLATLFVAGCGDDDNGTGPGNGAPPDLSGTYSLVSIEGGLTGGVPVGPNEGVTGTFTLQQTTSQGTTAAGTFTVSLVLPAGPFQDQGSYSVDSDGSWEQLGGVQQGSGTYSVVGSTLTVVVTDPAISASTSVWQKQ